MSSPDVGLCAGVNMFFQFRYAGGLYQYWVILLSYPLGKLTELFPRGRILNPGPFLAKVVRAFLLLVVMPLQHSDSLVIETTQQNMRRRGFQCLNIEVRPPSPARAPLDCRSTAS